ncbi:MAG: hypothetical protein J7K40_01110, partial [candidate division Zixibacteria bacterium]|nr:hypothetical protein [candidate division Zixibacteria bacterium]
AAYQQNCLSNYALTVKAGFKDIRALLWNYFTSICLLMQLKYRIMFLSTVRGTRGRVPPTWDNKREIISGLPVSIY